MLKRLWIQLDEDVYNFLKLKNDSKKGISKIIEGYLLANPGFRSEFSMYLAFPKTKPLMVLDWEIKNNETKERGDKKKHTKNNTTKT